MNKLEVIEHNGIKFYSDVPVGTKKMQRVDVGANSTFKTRTFTQLLDVMAAMAKKVGGNAVVGFRYQRVLSTGISDTYFAGNRHCFGGFGEVAKVRVTKDGQPIGWEDELVQLVFSARNSSAD